MNMKNKIILLVSIIISFSSCESWLDLVPEKDIETVESAFEKRATALEFLRGCYVYHNYIGSCTSDPAITGGDEFTATDYLTDKQYSYSNALEGFRIARGLQNHTDPIMPLWDPKANVYMAIRNCNTVIKNTHRVYNMTDREKKQFIAEAKAVKAMYYFELVRMYGPICLMPDNISQEAEISEMQLARSHVDTCFNEMIRLLDEAIPDLVTFANQTLEQYGHLNKEAAYFLRAKVLLYAASPLFNGNEWYTNFKNRDGELLFSSKYDKEKWKKAAQAADEAVEFCEGVGKYLYDEYSSEDSYKLNTIRSLQKGLIFTDWKSPEMIYGVYSYSSTDIANKILRYNPKNPFFNSYCKGALATTMEMAELFYSENGLPLSEDDSYPFVDRYKMGIEKDIEYKNVVGLNKPVLNLHLKREPRFYAFVGADKCVWKLNNEYEELDLLQDGTHGTDYTRLTSGQILNITGYYCKKFIDSETNHKNGANTGDWVIAPFPKYRLAELYLMQSEAWNEYEDTPTDKVYESINKVRSRAGIPTVQDSWGNYGTDKAKYRNKSGMREIIQTETMIEFAFEGHRFWDLRRWKKAHEYMTKPVRGWNVFGNTNESFYNGFEGPIIISSENKFVVPRDYFWPIRDEEILKANIKKNLGW